MPSIRLSAGTVHFDETGPPDGRPVVFVHGFIMGGALFAGLAGRLATRGLRCFAPTWPLGAHPQPMDAGSDLTPRGIARTIAEFLEALELEDVVLGGNDTGSARGQGVAVDHAARLGGLVLTNGDAFDNFPPRVLRPLIPLTRVPLAFRLALAPQRLASVRRSGIGYGPLSHHDVDHLARGWVRALLAHPQTMEDLRRFTSGLDSSITQDAARRLTGFKRPALIAWAADDRLFPLSHAVRLAELLPDSRLETIAGSRTYSMIDQPDQLADLVADFAIGG